MNQPVIVGAKRTPLGSFLGELSSFSAVDLGKAVVENIIAANPNFYTNTSLVVMGNVLPAGVGQNLARQIALKAGLDQSVDAWTLNKVCGSGLKSVMMVADQIKLGNIQLGIAGGAESMSNAPMLLPKVRQGYKYGSQTLLDHMALDGLEDAFSPAGTSMGILAEAMAQRYGFSKDQQDAYTLESTQRAINAVQNGTFKDEVISIEVGGRQPFTVESDEGPRRAKPEKIPTLKPAFQKDGTITAASASPISDGAAAVSVCSEEYAKANGMPILGRIMGYATHSQKPEEFTIAPVGAVKKLLDQLKWSENDVDLFEVNEAFSMVPMVLMQELNVSHKKINVKGGAVALGHPLGASGARVLVTLLYALKQRELKRGIATLCIGGGEGVALAVELV